MRKIFLLLFLFYLQDLYSNTKTINLLHNNNKNELKIGIGLEQGFNIGFNHYYAKTLNFGIGVGSHFPNKEKTHHYVVFAENNWHYETKKLMKFKPIFLFNQQVMYYKYSEPEFYHQAMTFALNIGYRFSKSNNFGFIFEIGPSITYTIKFEREPTCTVTPITNKVNPNFRILIYQCF